LYNVTKIIPSCCKMRSYDIEFFPLIISLVDLHEVWFSLLKDGCWMHDNVWIFWFILFEECIYKYMKFDFESAWNLFEYEFLILFFLKNTYKNALNLFFCAWCIYEYMKFLIEYEFWKCMFECMKFDFLFFLMHEIFDWIWIFNLNKIWWRMHLRMYKTWFFVFFFLNNVYMNA